MLETIVINRTKKHFCMQDGTILKFAKMFDERLKVTNDANACALALYMCDDGLWKGLDTRIIRDDETGEPATRRYSTKELPCDAFNRHGRFFRLADGGVIRFVATLGADLNHTGRSDYAVAVVQLPFDQLYRAIDVTMFDNDPNLCESFH